MFQEPTHEQTKTRHAEKPCDIFRALTIVSPGMRPCHAESMTGAPNAGYLWEQHCEKDLVKLG
jgi:hypothetical protein